MWAKLGNSSDGLLLGWQFVELEDAECNQKMPAVGLWDSGTLVSIAWTFLPIVLGRRNPGKAAAFVTDQLEASSGRNRSLAVPAITEIDHHWFCQNAVANLLNFKHSVRVRSFADGYFHKVAAQRK